ncbi:MAG TPA: hypothetical protein VFH30_13335 [Acidimicrobiales bacterium]|nr:hypothetical protein [Acidimicrobiales bacterium]
MRFAVETWAPDYGASVDGAALAGSDAEVDLGVEHDPLAWGPVRPQAGVAPAACVLFVDGVQRIDARIWITERAGEQAGEQTRQGVCASWAAGMVRCDGRARVVATEVRRGVLCPGAPLDPIVTRHGDYRPYPVADAGGDPIAQALGRARGDLEGRVAVEAMGSGEGRAELLVVDGPLGDRRHIPGAVGYVKTHHVSYLPAALQPVVTGLGVGDRTPLFAIGDRRFRYSWYLRLPGAATHPWWGIVRCEASGDLTRAEALDLADRVTATLPRFASQPHNDPRAPQNLHPIAGLERELRRRLGDPAVMDRALRRAAQSAGTSSAA